LLLLLAKCRLAYKERMLRSASSIQKADAGSKEHCLRHPKKGCLESQDRGLCEGAEAPSPCPLPAGERILSKLDHGVGGVGAAKYHF